MERPTPLEKPQGRRAGPSLQAAIPPPPEEFHQPQVAQNLQLLAHFVGHVAAAEMNHGRYVVAEAESWLRAIPVDIERGAL